MSAASDLASSLNRASATVQQVRETADQKMASSVSTINSLLNQFTAANNAVVTGLQTGANVSSAEDTRNSIVTQLAQQLGVSTTVAANGSESIYTESGVTLFQDTPRTVSFTRDPDAGRWVEWRRRHRRWRADHRRQFANAHSIGRACRICRVAGYARARISGPARPDRRRSHQRLRGKRPIGKSHACPRCRACSPRRERRPCRRCTATTGLAAAIEVNSNVDPSQGGNPNLLRDGGISDPGNPAYTYNTTGAASYTGRIQQLIGQISATQSFDPSAGLDSSASLTDYANASVSWLQAQNQQASDACLLSKRGRNAGKLGVIERDRRQSRRRDDQHAEPRELLRFDSEAVDDRHQHVLGSIAGGMTTVGANFVSTHFLANSLVAPVMQAQSQLTSAMTEMSTGEYANLGLQLGDQSGYELSLKEQVGQLQTMTTGNSVVSTGLSTAQNALSAIQTTAQTTLDNLAGSTQGANSAVSLQDMGQSGLQSLINWANTTSGDQYVFGGINSAVAPMADYYSTPASAAKTAIDQAFQTAFGVLPTDPGAREYLRVGHAELSFRAVRGALPGCLVGHGLVVSFERQYERRGRARSDSHNVDQRQSVGLSRARPGLRHAERVRRLRPQQRRATGRRHNRLLAPFTGSELDDQPSSWPRLNPECGQQRHQFHELSALDPASPDRRSRQRQHDSYSRSDRQPDQSDPGGLRTYFAPAAA